MSAMLSVSASAADRLATCIVYARLALAPGGLVLALQLARAGPVWLTRRFWALVEHAYPGCREARRELNRIEKQLPNL